MSLILPLSLDTSAAEPLRVTLKTMLERGEPIVLDASDVERMGQACMQVLVAAQLAARERSLTFEIVQPSVPFTEMVGLASLAQLASA